MKAVRFGIRLAATANRCPLLKSHGQQYGRRIFSSDIPGKDKFKEFKDEDASEILDVHEERLRIAESLLQERAETDDLEETPIERVYQLNVDELVELLKDKKAQDLAVLRLPPDLKYVDFLLIATGRSRRHIQSLGETIRKYAKDRLDNINNVPQLEGSDSEWIALDMGNICLHIMSPPLRGAYDLESLWSVGAKYDIKLHQQDEKILALLKKHSYSSYGSNANASVEEDTAHRVST